MSEMNNLLQDDDLPCGPDCSFMHDHIVPPSERIDDDDIPLFSVDAASLDMIRIVERGKPDPFKQVPALLEILEACIGRFRTLGQDNFARWVETKVKEIKGEEIKHMLDVPIDVSVESDENIEAGLRKIGLL